MKWIHIALIIFLVPSPTIRSQSEDAESIRIRYENQINKGITNALLSILSDQQFAISTSVNLKLETIEIPEIKSESKSQKGGEEAPQKLPGFDLNPVHDEPEISSKSNKSSRFSQQATINKVEVYLILDESIDEKTGKVAVSVAKHRLRTSFGKKAFLKTDLVNLARLHEANEEREWLTLLKENASDLAILSLILFFLLLFVLIYRRSPAESKNQEKIISELKKELVPEQDEKPQQSEDELKRIELRKLFNQIFTYYIANPKTTDTFVSQIGEAEKNIVKLAIDQSPFSETLSKSIGFKSDEFTAEISGCELSHIQNLCLHFEDFTKGQNMLLSQPFGFTNLIDSDSIKHTLGQNPEEIAIAICYLSKENSSKLLESYPSSVKAQVLATLQQPEFSSKAQEIVSKVDSKLRKKFQELQGVPEFGTSQKNHSIDILMRSDPEISDTIKKYGEISDIQLSDRYKGFEISFDEAKDLHAELLTQIVTSTDNDIIVKAFRGFKNEQDKSFLQGFNKMRSGIIKNLLTHYEADEEQTKSAQGEIMDQFRQKIRDQS